MTTETLPARISATIDWIRANDPVHIEWDPTPISDGYPLRSDYVELMWTPTIGPSCVMLARRLALWLDVEPDGFDVGLHTIAATIGLSPSTTRNGAVVRCIARLVAFHWASIHNETLHVVRAVPALTAKELHRRQIRAAR